MLVEDEITGGGKFKLSAEHFKIVEQEKYLKGKSKSYNWDEAKRMIRGKRKQKL